MNDNFAAGIVGRIMGNQVKAVLQDLLAEAEKVQQQGIDKSSDSMPSFEQ